jgi:hypothetical protein
VVVVVPSHVSQQFSDPGASQHARCILDCIHTAEAAA